MKKRHFYFLVFVLLISTSIVIAQSSTNYQSQRFVMHGGDTAVSNNYRVNAVIGQPATDVVVSLNHKVSGGFLFPIGHRANSGQKIWLPIITK